MAFALVYTAEHYVSDILVGWAYALFAFWAVNRIADALAARRAVALPQPTSPPANVPPPIVRST
jgi:membrane-associated phospholipid phosphatase